MTDNKTKKKEDARTISLLQRYEARYWVERFDCSLVELRAAIVLVGRGVRNVEALFRSVRKIKGR